MKNCELPPFSEVGVKTKGPNGGGKYLTSYHAESSSDTPGPGPSEYPPAGASTTTDR